MNKEFVPYQEALELKELGFDEPCFKLWEKTIMFTCLVDPSEFKKVVSERYVKAPTFSQASRWFREKYNLHVNKTGNANYTSFNITDYTSFNMIEPKMEVLSFVRYTDTKNHYEEAELDCLKKLIEIVKNGK